MTDKTNSPMVLVELAPEEVAWLADRLIELRSGWTTAALFKAQGIMERGEASEREMILKIEDNKRMEARIRNRILDRAADQGFGDL